MDEETEEYESTEDYYEEDENSEDYKADENADFPRVLKRLSSKIEYTEYSILQLAKFHIEQLSYVMPIATHNGLLDGRMLTSLCYGYLGVSNCKYPCGVTLDPYISYGGDLGLLASAKGGVVETGRVSFFAASGRGGGTQNSPASRQRVFRAPFRRGLPR